MIPAPDHFSLVGTRHRKTPGFTMGRTRFSFASGIERTVGKIREAGNSSAYRSRLTFPAFNSANLPFPRGSTRITHLFAHCRYILARPRHYRTPPNAACSFDLVASLSQCAPLLPALYASPSAVHLRTWSENRSPSGRSVLYPLTFQNLQSLHPARRLRARLRL